MMLLSGCALITWAVVAGLSEEKEAARLQPAQHPLYEALELLFAQVHQQPVREDEVKTEKDLSGQTCTASQETWMSSCWIISLSTKLKSIRQCSDSCPSILNCGKYPNTHLFLGRSSFVTSAWMKEALLWWPLFFLFFSTKFSMKSTAVTCLALVSRWQV